MARRIPIESVDIEALREHLTAGGVVAIPTESSYGLAADPRSAAGVEAIYRIKTRDRGKPLPVVAADAEQLAVLGMELDDSALHPLIALWPAPLTLIAPAGSADGPWPASADGATLAARVPAHPPLLTVLSALGFPLTATSANVAGQAPILDPQELTSLLNGHDAWILDGGILSGGAPSTMVLWSGGAWRVIREGRFPVDRLP